MSNIIVTHPGGKGEALVVRATLTIHIAHRIAEAFTKMRDMDYPLHDLLVSTFGDHTFRWYCVDMSNSAFEISFSDAPNPRVLKYQGAAAAIATADRAPLLLRLQFTDLIKPGRLNPNADHPYHISA